ncbi:MAG: hypothetical protein V2J13_10685 [Cycloclasticus sp.]|jgi:hypothetical protein|nr:hypothetical protein [Cycloclasticus sp.]
MSNLVSGEQYPVRSNRTAIVQCILGGGTAILEIQSAGASAFTTAKTFSADEVVKVDFPAGLFRVTLTGAAAVAVNWAPKMV